MENLKREHCSHDILKKLSDLDPTSSYFILAVWEQKTFKLMYFIQTSLLNTSTRGIRNSLEETRENRILWDILDLEHFEMHTAPHLLCIFGMREDNCDQSASRKLIT